MPGLKIFWKIIGRSWIVYVGLAMILCLIINFDAIQTSRVNFLMQGQEDVKYYEMGLAAYNKTAFKMAIQYYEQWMKYAPKDGVIHGNMGYCYYHLNDQARALEEYHQAIKLEPVMGVLKWDLALIHFKKAEIDQAIVNWNDFLSEVPYLRQYLKGIKARIVAQGKQEALVFVQRMEARLREDELDAYIKLCESFYSLKKYNLVREVASRGLKLFPQSRWLHYLGGLADYATGRLPSAALHFTESIKSIPTDINSIYYHSLCMRGLGRDIEEQRDLKIYEDFRKNGVQPLAMPKDNLKLHFNTELLFLRYHLKI